MTELAQVGSVSDDPLSSIEDTGTDMLNRCIEDHDQRRKSNESFELLALNVNEETRQSKAQQSYRNVPLSG